MVVSEGLPYAVSIRHFSDDERRDRLARRHGLTPGGRYPDVIAATDAMTALHATEAATVHLALWARVADITIDDVERALYEDRSLVKQLSMRRTLWAVPRDLLPALWGSAAARVAATERKRIVKDVIDARIAADGEAWVSAARAATLERLADGEALPARSLREAIPELAGTITIGRPETKWGGDVSIAPRVLTLLGAEGRIVRGRNAGHWRLNKPTWTRTEHWLGETPTPLSTEHGYAELVRRWLWTFGPGTETDIVWWLGATKTAVRRALADVGAELVQLDRDEVGWVLPGDTEPEPTVEPWGALLPTLDPTTMGWKQRDFYLDDRHTPYLVDTNGNAGNTAWWDGQIVGTWVQDDDGAVHVVLRDDVGGDGVAALDAEADRLTAWLDGVRITNVYASPLMKGAVLP